MSTIAYLEGEGGTPGGTSSAPATTPASTTTTTPATTPTPTTPTPVPEKKEDGGRKARICVSVIKGEACRTQMEGKVCPYSHEGAPAPETLTRVYICHLPLTFSNDDVQKLATPYGKIQESRVLVDPRSNVSRGVAFVHYEKHEEAEAAIKAINELKLPNHPTPLAARYARRNRPGGGRRSGRRGGRRSRSRSPPRRRRYPRSPPRRRGPGGPRRRYRSYDDEYDDYDDYGYDYPPRRRPGYGPPEDDYGPDRDYAPYGRIQPAGGRPGSGYSTYVPPTVTNTAAPGAGGGGYGSQAPSSSYGGGGGGGGGGYGGSNPSSGRVDGYRSYPQNNQYNAPSSGYGGPPSGQRY